MDKIPFGVYDVVNISWVREQMELTKTTQQDIANDLELSRYRVSDLLNPKGRNPLNTKFQKLTFYYYFKDKKYYVIDNMLLAKSIQRIRHNIYFDECSEILKAIGITHQKDGEAYNPTGNDLKKQVVRELKQLAKDGFYKNQFIRMKCPCFIIHTGLYLHDAMIFFTSSNSPFSLIE